MVWIWHEAGDPEYPLSRQVSEDKRTCHSHRESDPFRLIVESNCNQKSLSVSMSRLARHRTGMLNGRRAPIGTSMTTDCRCRIDLAGRAHRYR